MAYPDNGENELRTKKRRRPTVVCTNCKRRKSKCDRLKPICGNCSRLGDQATCVYGPELGNKPVKSESPRLISHYFETVRSNQPTIIDLTPGGILINRKRSCTSYIAPLTPAAAKRRDPYLQALESMCAVDKARRKTQAKGTDKTLAGPSAGALPQSMRYLESIERQNVEEQATAASKHKQMCKHIFEKFGKYRRDRSSIPFVEDKNPIQEMPDAQDFFNYVLPHFLSHNLVLCPIFDGSRLERHLKALYQKCKETSEPQLDVDDQACYSIVLMVTCIVQLSVKFAQSEDSPLLSKIASINTKHYISIANDCIFTRKSQRKCSLLRLQSLLLLRFYHWCAPDDGDGEYLQQSNMLMGTIVAACYTLGIGWQCFRDPEGLLSGLTSNGEYNTDDLDTDVSEYKMIWSVVLHWDRKVSLLTGQQCIIGNSIKFNGPGVESPTINLLRYDSIMHRISCMVSDDPRHVDSDNVKRLLEIFGQAIKMGTGDTTSDSEGNFELTLISQLVELVIDHAHMVHSEKTASPEEFHEGVQSLFEKILQITYSCEHYLYSYEGLDKFTKFYTNKIVDIAFDHVSAILPSLILRSGRSCEKDTKLTLQKFFNNLLSACFNTLGIEYYQCFKRLFTSKLVYTTITLLSDEDPWNTVLEFLLSPENRKDLTSLKQPTNFDEFMVLYEKEAAERSASEVWDAHYTPRSLFSFDLDTRSLESRLPFSVKRRSDDYDIFAAFFNNTATPFLASASNVAFARKKSSGESAFTSLDYNLLHEITYNDSSEFLNFFEPDTLTSTDSESRYKLASYQLE